MLALRMSNLKAVFNLDISVTTVAAIKKVSAYPILVTRNRPVASELGVRILEKTVAIITHVNKQSFDEGIRFSSL